MKRSALRRRTRLRSMSPKRRRAMPLRRAVVAEVNQRDETCQAATLMPAIACGGLLDVHEVAPRSVDPAGWLIPARCVLVCRRHHDWIGDNPNGAHGLGLHRYSWEVSE